MPRKSKRSRGVTVSSRLQKSYFGTRELRLSARGAQQENIPAGCSKWHPSKAARSSATEAYPWGTLQGDARLRTTLGDIFSILLTSRAMASNRGSSKAPNRDLAPYNRG